MKYIIALTLSLLVSYPAFAAEESPAVLKKPIVIPGGTSPRMSVTFNHTTHKQIKCQSCHHMKTETGKRFVKCTIEECHSTAGARERDTMSMFMAFHDKKAENSCYGCHKREVASHPDFKGCRPCHTGPMGKNLKAEATQK